MRETAIGQRLGDMGFCDRGRAAKVGDGARHFEHPVIAARRQFHPLRRLGQEPGAACIRRGDLVQEFAFGLGIGADAIVSEAFALDGARTRHATRDLGAALGRCRQGKIAGRYAGHFHMQIDAIEQGAGNARLVIDGAFGRAPAALRRIAEIPKVGRCDLRARART